MCSMLIQIGSTAVPFRGPAIAMMCDSLLVPQRYLLKTTCGSDCSFLDAVVDGVFTVPGDGDVDFEPILKVMADAHYRGWLVVEAEQDPAKANPFDYAKKGYEALSGYAASAGLI